MVLDEASGHFHSFNDQLLAHAVVGGVGGLYRSDGSAAGTHLVRGGRVIPFADFGGNLYSYEPSSQEPTSVLLRSDGSSYETAEVAELPGTWIVRSIALDGWLVFQLESPTGEPVLWRTDGTAPGTSLAYDLGGRGLIGSDARRLYFSPIDENIGSELWVGDAMMAPVLLKNIAPDGPQCAGDCFADGSVAIDELIVGVAIALGTRPIEACMAFDGDGSDRVEISELIAGVSNALAHCAASLAAS